MLWRFGGAALIYSAMTDNTDWTRLLSRVRACTACELPLGPRPILSASPTARRCGTVRTKRNSLASTRRLAAGYGAIEGGDVFRPPQAGKGAGKHVQGGAKIKKKGPH